MTIHKIIRAIFLGPKVASRNAQNDSLASMVVRTKGATMMVEYFIAFKI
jgi:hypothetical protein